MQSISKEPQKSLDSMMALRGPDIIPGPSMEIGTQGRITLRCPTRDIQMFLVQQFRSRIAQMEEGAAVRFQISFHGDILQGVISNNKCTIKHVKTIDSSADQRNSAVVVKKADQMTIIWQVVSNSKQ